MTIMTMINRMTPGDRPELPSESRSPLRVWEVVTVLAGVGMLVSVTSGKSSAIGGKGARVGVLLEMIVPVRTSMPGVNDNGIYVLSGSVGKSERGLGV